MSSSSPSNETDLHSLSHSEAYAFCAALRDDSKRASGQAERSALAAALPQRLEGLMPEVQLLVAEVALELRDAQPTLATDIAEQPRRVRAAHHRVALRVGGLPPGITDMDLHDAVVLCDPIHLERPLEVVARCATSSLPDLQEQALRIGVQLVSDGSLRARDLLPHALELADASDGAVRRDALTFLRSPVVLGEERRRAALAHAAISSELLDVALAGVHLLDRLGHGQDLLDAADDATLPDAVRTVALLKATAHIEPEQLDALVNMISRDPYALSEAGRNCLLDLHQRGVFLREPQLPGLLDIYDRTPTWTAQELLRVAYTERKGLTDLLAALDPADDRWVSRACLLGMVLDERAPALLAEKLRGAKAPHIAEALIDAAAYCPGFDDEQALLNWLDRLPEACLRALRVHGGETTLARLRAVVRQPHGLGTSRSEASFTYVALAKDKVDAYLEVAYSPQPGIERLRRMGPPALDEWFCGEGVQGLEELAKHGDARHIDTATPLFRKEFERCFKEKARAEASAYRRHDGVTPQELEVERLCKLMQQFGERLIERGHAVHGYLTTSPLQGSDYLLRILLDWLAEEPHEELAMALLDEVAKLPVREANLRELAPWWRAKSSRLRAAALRAILAAEDASVGFAFSLSNLATEADPKVRRQALLAVAQHGVTGAEPLVRQALTDRNMNVRKTAAAALTKMGTVNSIPALLQQLAHHDVPGLRSECEAALARCAEGTMDGVLRHALETATDSRSRELLAGSLVRRLSAAQLGKIAAGDPAVQASILAVLDAGERPARGAVTEVYRAARQTPPHAHDIALRVATEQLVAQGFSEEAARQLTRALDASQLDHTPRDVLKAVRDCIVPWARWALRNKEDEAWHGQRLALQASETSKAGAPMEALFRIAEVVGKEPASAWRVLRWCEAGRDDIVAHDRMRMILLLRSIAPGLNDQGIQLWQTLSSLGACLTEADLAACLRLVKGNGHGDLLRRAFAIEANGPRIDPTWDPKFCEQAPSSSAEWRRWAATYTDATETERRRSLDLALQARPMGLPPRRKGLWVLPHTPRREQAKALLAALASDSDEERAQAADRVLADRAHERRVASADLVAIATALAPKTIEAVLDRYLDGRIATPRKGVHDLLAELKHWPSDERRAKRAQKLLELGGTGKARRWLDDALDGWLREEKHWQVLLDAADDDDVSDLAGRRLARGEAAFAKLLTEATRQDLLFASEGAEQEEEEEPEAAPLSERTLQQLADEARLAKGEAALPLIRELARRGSESERELLGLTRHREWRVRNAALRGVSAVADKQVYLDAAAAMFQDETQDDALRRLSRILAHGGRVEVVPKLVQLLLSAKPRQNQFAREALLALGQRGVRALRKARRRARPDQTERIDELLQALDD